MLFRILISVFLFAGVLLTGSNSWSDKVWDSTNKPPARTRISLQESRADSTRVIVLPTAAKSELNQISISSTDFMVWRLDASVTRHLDLGVYGVVAPLLSGASPCLRLHLEVNDMIHFGYYGEIGYFRDTKQAADWGMIVGGGPIFTIKKNSHLFNVHLAFYYGRPIHLLSIVPGIEKRRNRDWNGENDIPNWIAVPTLGYRLNINKVISFSTELIVAISRRSNSQGYGFISYGIRFHGATMYIEAGFILPISEDTYDEDHYAYFPLGLPLFTLGKSFPFNK